MISESSSPSVFLECYGAIINAANATNQFCSETVKTPEEDRIRLRLVEAIGQSLQPNPRTLPAVTHSLTINGENWHVSLSATAIPHLRASVVEWEPKSETEIAGRFEVVRWLLQNRPAGFGRIENNQLHGKTWELYLFSKIHLLKKLQKAFSRDPYQKKAVLLTPERMFPQLEGCMPAASTFENSPEAIRKFLDECDHVMTEQVGQTELIRYLEGSPISPKEFLHAQKPGIFGMHL